MNAYEIPNLRFSLPAGGAVERYRFVSVDGNGAGIQATASTQVVGASYNKVAAGQVLEAADGIVMVEAGGAVTAGAAVSSDADGKAVAVTAASQGAEAPYAYTPATKTVGIAFTAATEAGQLVAVKIAN